MKTRKKNFVWMLVLGILLVLCACGNPSSDGGAPGSGAVSGGGTAMPGGSDPVSGGKGGSTENDGNHAATTENGALSLLYDLQGGGRACATDSGCYYFNADAVRLADGRFASHLMYVDAATRQEIYLCSNAACNHDTADCTSVFPEEEFPSYTTGLFVWKGGLYVMGKQMDRDGSSETVFFGGDGIGMGSVESKPTVLYRADLDGTNRNKVYEFDPAVSVEDLVMGDGEQLYFITKKLTTQQAGATSYQTSTERKLVSLDVAAGTEREVCSMDFGDDVTWQVIGCSGRKLVLLGVDFGRYVSPEELFGDDNGIYDDSDDVFALLDVDDGSLREVYRVHAPKARGYEADEDRLYVSVDGSGCILSVDLHTGEEKTLCMLEENLIWGRMGDKLYCYDSSDYSYRFVDVNTGEISQSRLVNKTTGWSLDFLAEIGDQVLVNYDSDGSFGSDGSFSATGEHYGLIGREDLFAGVDRIVPIRMVGRGMQ